MPVHLHRDQRSLRDDMSHLNTLKGLVLGMALATPALASAATEGPSTSVFVVIQSGS